MAEGVAIIGAGLSGLTLALALHQQGITPAVYESWQGPLKIGGATSVKVGSILMSRRFKPPTATLLEVYELGNKEKYGYPANRIYRYELIDLILSKVHAEDIRVVYGHKFSHVVEETADYITWQTEDGQMLRASCLVGADGIHSSVRKYLYPHLVPKFTNMAGINASVPSVPVTHFGKKISKALTIIARGVGAFIVAPQKVDGSELFIGKQRRMEELSREGWEDFLADKESLVTFLQEDAQVFGDIAVTSTKIIDVTRMIVWPFYLVPELDRWSSVNRRVVILGDAAHAIPPSAGLGISQAFEDVYAFALLLAASKKGMVSFEASLTFWQDYRQARVDKELELNKQVDLRRLPPNQAAGSDTQKIAKEDLEFTWLYSPSLKADVDGWIKSVASDNT
ncbi:hypothetical protein PV10_06839 [Exophiala mesophila]|uniref:FAD-binding domain-containing protein n=1 Tax=Exophiala mesophila TaxID=212818 RepID=A0A0D1WKG7_EXOME|nr:uncharacterized protein PV10_06839 [Exophiala mesophila]KIV89440.1 hypothetical protein PV10_06839 [Exophiala mesophila]